MNAIHPDQVLSTLKAHVRPQKQCNLDITHAACRELHQLGKGRALFHVGFVNAVRKLLG